MSDRVGSPIMIVGIRPRSGTNYLCDLINQHPDVARPSPIDEDYFLAHADKLEAFAHELGRHWSHLSRPVPPGARQDVLSALGVGLMGWLTALAGSKRALTKSPLPGRLDLCFQLFPAAKLLIIVRDGRSVIESHIRSWPGDGRFGGDLFTGLCEAWAQSAETILSFRMEHPVTEYPYMLVRYEDLVRDPEDRMRSIFGFLDLDDSAIDYDALWGLPVRGSSTFGRPAGQSLDWAPVKKDSSFDPLRRWAGWTDAQHRQFNDIAGAAMAKFGYALDQ